MKTIAPVSRVLLLVSALAMVVAFYVPVWQILMWAPQYPEGLEMKIWLYTLTGDYKIISGLNHYIGMKHIEVGMFPEFEVMPYLVAGLIAFGVFAAWSRRRFMLLAYAGLIIAAGVAGMADFYKWGYDYGHNLDPRAPIVVPGMAYQPPLIGTKQLLNFTAFSGPDAGGYVFLASGLIAIGCAVYELRRGRNRREAIPAMTVAGVILFAVSSCSAVPEPLHFGKDGCHHCKMTLVDNRFGGEVVTVKGKIYKFDDLNCMTAFLRAGEVAAGSVAHILVVDYARPGDLIDARSAVYINAEAIRSPMAGNTAAFTDRRTANRANAGWAGRILQWGDVNR